jgi:hypothetical protein
MRCASYLSFGAKNFGSYCKHCHLSRHFLPQILHEQNNASYLPNDIENAKLWWINNQLEGFWDQSLFWDLV